jgi:hypothetical protein
VKFLFFNTINRDLEHQKTQTNSENNNNSTTNNDENTNNNPNDNNDNTSLKRPGTRYKTSISLVASCPDIKTSSSDLNKGNNDKNSNDISQKNDENENNENHEKPQRINTNEIIDDYNPNSEKNGEVIERVKTNDKTTTKESPKTLSAGGEREKTKADYRKSPLRPANPAPSSTPKSPRTLRDKDNLKEKRNNKTGQGIIYSAIYTFLFNIFIISITIHLLYR